MRALLVLIVSTLILQGQGSVPPKPGQGELRYRATLHFREDKPPLVTRFVLIPTPVVETRNKIKKPRLGGWRLESVLGREDSFAQAAVLARVEKLLYFSGPIPGLIPKPIFIRYEDRRCQVWQVPTPPGLHVYAYLVEFTPGILALSYLSGIFETGELVSVELQLESFRVLQGVAPAENGTILLATLQRLAMKADSTVMDEQTQVIE